MTDTAPTTPTAPVELGSDVRGIRKIIKDRMDRLGWSIPDLVDRCETPPGDCRRVARNIVYSFLAGKRDVRADNLESILAVLGLKIQAPKKNKKRRAMACAK